MRALLVAVFGFALLAPPLLVGICTWLWLAKLAHPWWFAALGLFSLYCVAAYQLLRQFRDVGISGQRSADGGIQVEQLIHSEALFSLMVFLAAAMLCLTVLRWALGK